MTGTYQFTIISYALLINSVLSVYVALFSWRHRSMPSAKYLVIWTIDIAIISFTYILESAATEIPVKLLWTKISYPGLLAAVTLLLLFVLDYTGRELHTTPFRIALLSLFPFIATVLVFTNDWHHLVWTQIIQSPNKEINLAVYEHGTGYWIIMGYIFITIAITDVMIIQAAFRLRKAYRQQAIALFTAVAVFVVIETTYLTNILPIPGFDPAPFSFTISGLILTWTMSKHRFLHLTPIARERVIETMSDGVIVLDRSGHIQDYNPAAESLIASVQPNPTQTSHLFGRPLDEVLGVAELATFFNKVEEIHYETTLPRDPKQRMINMHISPLLDKRGKLNIQIITLRDTSAYHRLVKSEREARQLAEVQREIGTVLNSTLNFDRVLHLILEQIERVIPFDGACIWIVDEKDKVTLHLTEHIEEETARIGTTFDIADTPLAQAVEQQQPVLIAGKDKNCKFFGTICQDRFKSLLIIPLLTREQIVGLLCLVSANEDLYQQKDIDTATQFASQVAIAIENSQLYSKTQRKLVEQSIVNDIISTTSSILALEDLLPLIYTQIQRFLPASSFVIASYEQETGKWTELFRSDREQHEENSIYELNQGITGLILKQGKPILANTEEEINQLLAHHQQTPVGIQPKSIMGVPVVLHHKVTGAMVVKHYNVENHFNEEDFSLLKTIGGQVALALERVRLHEETKRMAITDEMTGLFNYRYFNTIAGKEFERSKRYHKPFTLIIIDIDRFKLVNDTYGHLIGDQVLHALSHILLQSLRSSDIVARYGGEEFVMILPETNLEEAANITRRLNQVIADTVIEIPDGKIRITTSMGVAAMNENIISLNHLLENADKALYAAKHDGRNSVYATGREPDQFYRV